MIAAAALVMLLGADDACHDHYAALRYRDAISACTEALAAGGDRSELYTLIALSLAGAGDSDKARRVFAALLAMNPGATLPAGLSPKLRAPFDAAKDAATVISLTAEVDSTTAGTTLDVTVAVSDGASRPVSELALSAGDRLARMRRADPTRLSAPWPASALGATLFAYDVLGGELASAPVPLLISRPDVLLPSSSRPAAALVEGVADRLGGARGAGRRGARLGQQRLHPRARRDLGRQRGDHRLRGARRPGDLGHRLRARRRAGARRGGARGDRLRPAALALLLAACVDTHVDYVGKRCATGRPCPDGLVCDAASATCQPSPGSGGGTAGAGGSGGGAASCPSELPISCTLRDVALAAGATPSASDLKPGTRFVLQNTDYPALRVQGSGSAGCPIVLSGPARFTDTLTLDGEYLKVVDVSFEVTQRLSALSVAPDSKNVELVRLHFSKTATGRAPNGSEFPFDLYLDTRCAQVSVSQSDFTGTRAPAVFSDATCTAVTVKGNRFHTDADGPTVQIEGQTATIEGNELTGAMSYAAIEFVNGGSGVVRRNWLHELTASGLVAVRGAAQVVSNTFVDVTGDAASCGTFRDNAVVRVRGGVTCGSASRGYNFYDAVGSTGTLDSTERTGSAQLAADGVPAVGSPLVDAADPALAVPRGGGSRADIGAFERGATRAADGTYCP
ncbi:MAG: right-handed parallel beta-helix repeat-containing protein [Archangiaceae bacterium]|nr:right-handed parallel beta-helix repeat-containing protein [Archangiaceae bacterium]